MTEEQQKKYETTDALREMLSALKGRKFRFVCGHYALSGIKSEMTSPYITTTKNPKLSVQNAGITEEIKALMTN